MPLYTIEGDVVNNDFIGLIKSLLDDDKDDRKHQMYSSCVQHAKEMSVHLYGVKPVDLLNMVRPREDNETKEYRLQAYQPTTKSTAGKALSIVSKIFNPTLYNIQWPEDQPSSSKELEKYALEDFPKYNSVIQFLQSVGLKKMLSDPNGVMAISIINPFISDTETPQATVKLYGSKSIWWFDKNMYLIFKKIEERNTKPDLYYFDYYDNDVIAEFTVERVAANDIIITELWKYSHNCGDVPVWELGGVPEVDDAGNEYYKSFFEPAVPFWNLAITHESDLFGAYINHLHPIRTELSEECDFVHENQRCVRGSISYPNGKKEECPACHGTGLKSVKSPYGVYRFNREKLEAGTNALEPVSYVTIPTEPTAMLEKRVEQQHIKGLYALNMDVLDKIGANQSGIAKVIDRGELYDFLYTISSIMFDVHLSNIFYYFNKIMFGVKDSSISKNNEKNLPTINKPVQFDISSALELIEQLKQAKDAGLNPQYIREKQKSVNEKEFASDPDLREKMSLMLDLDPCPEYTVEELDLLGGRSVPKKFIVIHHNIEYLIEKAFGENKKQFLSMSKKDQFTKIEKLAEELLKEEIESKLDTSAIETSNTFGNPGGDNSQGQQQIGGNNQNLPTKDAVQGSQQAQTT